MNNKIILYGLIAVVVLLVAFNFNKITGQTTKEQPTMAVSKDAKGNAMLENGKVKLTIYGYLGNCVDRTLSLYQKRTDNLRPLTLSTNIEIRQGTTKLCEKVNFQYSMQGDYHGDFYFEGKDTNTGKAIKAEFSLP